MNEKKYESGDCIIDWEAEEDEDEDDYSPYEDPHSARRKERDIEREHQRRMRRYKETGEY